MQSSQSIQQPRGFRIKEAAVYMGLLVGILRALSSGVFIIAVRSDARRQGIATALLDAAAEGSASLKPDFSKTKYSQDGQALVDAYRKRRKMETALYIDVDAFVKDISEGDGEWFERIAERELEKLEIIRNNRA
jgi:GNAT superfamily N-acetyltransferase